jgi:hypothetical protein
LWTGGLVLAHEGGAKAQEEGFAWKCLMIGIPAQAVVPTIGDMQEVDVQVSCFRSQV